jgi:hypothetical protein
VTRHVVRPSCRHKCRFLQISDELWLCPHAAFGRLSYLKGAIEEGRRLLDRQGGYEAVLARIVAAEDQLRIERAEERLEAQQRAQKRLRYQ